MRKYNPEIRIVYPEASEAALLLTEAMIRRSSGKRTVETESEEKEYNGEALFGNALACRTSTGVDLTLRLNPDAMDYALTTLIAKNLTEEEKRQIRMETDSMEIVDLLSPAQAAEAAGGACTAEVASACRAADGATTQSGEQEEMVEVGKISEKVLKRIIGDAIDMGVKGHGSFDAINHAIHEVKEHVAGGLQGRIEEDTGLIDQLAVLICGAQRVTQKCTTSLKLFATDADHYIKESFDDEAEYVVTVRELTRVLSDVQGNFAEDPKLTLKKALEIRAAARVKKDLDELDKKGTVLG